MKRNQKQPQPVVNAALPQPRAMYCTITPEQFRENAHLQELMASFIDDVLLVAFAAADMAEEDYAAISSPTDLARDALRNAERVGIARYKKTLLSLAKTWKAPDAVQPNYSGKDEFDRLADEI